MSFTEENSECYFVVGDHEDMGPMTLDELLVPPPVEAEHGRFPDEPMIRVKDDDEVWCDRCGFIGYDRTIWNCELCGAIWPADQIPLIAAVPLHSQSGLHDFQEEEEEPIARIPSKNPSMFLRQKSVPLREEITGEDKEYNAAYYKCLHFNNINLRDTPLVYSTLGRYYFNNPVTGFVERIDRERYEELGGME
jgi:hypothetical protein